MGEDAREAVGPLVASSKAPALQPSLPGVGLGEDARDVEGPVEASSEAHARQQSFPGVSEHALEVGGYVDDAADFNCEGSEASSEPAPNVQEFADDARTPWFRGSWWEHSW